jgi:hypothetical protein
MSGEQTPAQAAKERELFTRLGRVKQYPIAPDEPASTAQPQGQPYVMQSLRRISPEEARRLGHPIRNELIISPVPRPGRPTR